MQAEITSFWEWLQYFSDEKTCLQAIVKQRWPEGFCCPRCQHGKGWLLRTRHVFECADCYHHTSITAGTLFHNTKLPLVKWFWLPSDKGSISALLLTKLIGVSWLTAQRMVRKFRIAMGDQNSLYKLTGTIELDDVFVGEKRSGKRGRGAEGKTAILVVCEHNDGKPGFVAMKVLTEEHHHVAKVTPPELVDEWLSWVHIVISNFKSYLLGTYHGVSGQYVHEYLDEFCYRLNRLLRVCIAHKPIFLKPVVC